MLVVDDDSVARLLLLVVDDQTESKTVDQAISQEAAQELLRACQVFLRAWPARKVTDLNGAAEAIIGAVQLALYIEEPIDKQMSPGSY